jgi:hypothetical protein
MSEAIYVGKGKQSKYGYKFSICISDLPKEHINEYNGKEYMNFELKEMRQPDKFGKTHTVTVDTWRPEKKETEDTRQIVSGDITDDNNALPF